MHSYYIQYVGIRLHPYFNIMHTFSCIGHIHIFCQWQNTIKSCPAAKWIHFIVYMYLLNLYTTLVVWQTKYELVTCITCVLHVITAIHVDARIARKRACAHHSFSLHVVNMKTHTCTDMRV